MASDASLGSAAARLRRRVAWSGPLLMRPGDDGHRAGMARAAAYLYAAGASLVLLSLAVPGAADRQELPIALLAVVAYAGAATHLVVFDRLPVAGFHASGLTGTALVSLCVHFAGGGALGYVAIYLWIVLFAFFFYDLAGALLQTGAVVAAEVGLLLAGDGVPGVVPAGVLLSLGVFVVAGSLVLAVKTRLYGVLAQVEASERRYRSLVEELPLVTYVDRLDEVSSNLYSSPQIEPLLGYPRARWTEHADLFVEVLHPDDRERVLALHRRTRETLEPFEAEYRAIAADGRVVWLRDHAVVVRDGDGRPLFLQGFLVDVTERKELEERLQESRRLEAVGRLAGGVAHDFNNLLTAITGYVGLAGARAGGDDELRRYVEEVGRAAERAAALTNQLLAFGRRQVVRPEPLDLRDVVAGVEELLRTLAGARAALETRLAAEPLVVEADRGQLEQVLVNLVVNARDAMPDGGTIAIGVHRAPGRVAFSVADGGVGMDEATRAQIFEPFFTTKELGRGTGLGLATVYGIVSQLGGEIRVDTAPGAGATFTVLLPEAAGEPRRAALPTLVPRAAPGRETVLVVEDEDVVRSLVAEILEDAGYDVLPAADAAEARVAWEDGRARPRLLLTDVVMPGLNGRELADELRHRDPDLRVLYMSGYAHSVLAERGGGTDGAAFIAKPFTADELTQAVRAALDAPATAAV